MEHEAQRPERRRRSFRRWRERWRGRQAGPPSSFTPAEEKPLRVLVLADRADRARGSHWAQTLWELRDRVKTEVVLRRPADDVVAALDEGKATLIECLRHAEVLVVNWDAINGDPDFGADLALEWCKHRRYNILSWVEDGGVLVIEGQANLGVPTQESYDALLGPRELDVCGLEDRLDVRKQQLRVGERCRSTREARSSRLLALVGTELTATGGREHDEMFPPTTAGRLVAPFLRRGRWPLLYRGWFRFRSQWLRRRRFSWVPLMTTGDRRINHPTMLVARSGRGAIFASTMLLAGSNVPGLVEAILESHGALDGLPRERRVSAFLSRHKSDVFVPVAAAIVVTAVSPLLGPTYAGIYRTLIGIGVAAVFYLGSRLFFATRRLVRDLREI